MNKKILTLCIIHQHSKILLGMKKRGFGAGKWNGFGGKVQEGETILEAAKREVLEEAGIEVNNLEKIGMLDFEFEGNPEILETHIFKTIKFIGQPAESEEMKPEWFNVEKIPFSQMWADDLHWFPYLLADKKFRGKFWFDVGDVIKNFELNGVEEI